MGLIRTDADRLIAAAALKADGHTNKAARIYQDMANEFREPQIKDQLWLLAESARLGR